MNQRQCERSSSITRWASMSACFASAARPLACSHRSERGGVDVDSRCSEGVEARIAVEGRGDRAEIRGGGGDPRDILTSAREAYLKHAGVGSMGGSCRESLCRVGARCVCGTAGLAMRGLACGLWRHEACFIASVWLLARRLHAYASWHAPRTPWLYMCMDAWIHVHIHVHALLR